MRQGLGDWRGGAAFVLAARGGIILLSGQGLFFLTIYQHKVLSLNTLN